MIVDTCFVDLLCLNKDVSVQFHCGVQFHGRSIYKTRPFQV